MGRSRKPECHVQVLTIPHILPGLNDILRMRGRGHYAWNAKKQALEEEIYWLCREQGVVWQERAHFTFRWKEPNRRRDPDNVAAGGRKIILDGLVKARRLPGDGWKHVVGWRDEFVVDKDSPGVEVMWGYGVKCIG
jgi:hypothetical protein